MGRDRWISRCSLAAPTAIVKAEADDRELGLGPEGPVLAALGEGASASATPVRGRAVFLAVTKVAILDPIPKLRVVELAPDIKVPVVSVSLDVISVAGDPANIGAKPRRIIHTRLIDSKVL